MSSPLVLGIVAHVDAGKTSLTERLLLEAGVLDTPGSVDAGTTRTDSMDLERRRGITIRASVTTFAAAGLEVTVVDTPGHPDFVAEVERSLTVLDAAVLVVSAVEGVQPQTVVLWRALRRLGVPTVLFVNKVDRAGADPDVVLERVRRRLTPHLVPLTRVRDAGSAHAEAVPVPLDDETVVLAVAEVDDDVLRRWAEDRPVGRDRVRAALRSAVRAGRLTPVLAGSAVTGTGVPDLPAVLARVVAPDRRPRAEAAPHRPAATVFAVDRDERGRRVWVRMWDGELAVRDRVVVGGRAPHPVTEVAVSRPDGLRPEPCVGAGEVAAVRGPAARVGDTVGTPPARARYRFAPGRLESLVTPEDPADRPALFAALAELADEDPLIALRRSAADAEAAVTLHGEVQREVVAALLEERFGMRARFSPPGVVLVERVTGRGAALERLGTGGNPYLATVGLAVAPGPTGSGVVFRPGVQPGRLLPAFVAATEEGVRTALRSGRYGWEVLDCMVTMTDSLYYPRQSRPHQGFDKSMSTVAADFRLLSQVVVHAALARAGTVACEPVDRIEVELPAAALGAVLSAVGRLGGTPEGSRGADGWSLVTGTLPTRSVAELTRLLPDLTGGEGSLVTRPDHHAPVRGEPPRRRAPDPDPRDREAWFRDAAR
ncbi:elongation factor G [Phycicoccus flavus]|uniref:elongation factor G n=1 Tax=Phycicoccus flavus TaxID=2502783 RepID=UPI000FEB67BB|nr:TetM/TetW/TetO/TetS family tetracycline resistance ribosomal protection protein [Phycicoccus flavus]NHA69075.1 TetM/TetW/TetO/TetS family tetracycline resistance ribosomal protection protein [Phycicoccus flavus]